MWMSDDPRDDRYNGRISKQQRGRGVFVDMCPL
jgi:hypothetical protein